MSVTILTQK